MGTFLLSFQLFQLSYRPGSRNGKSDALSCQYLREEGPSESASILPNHCFIANSRFSVEQKVLEAPHQHPSSGGEPEEGESVCPCHASRLHVFRIHGLPTSVVPDKLPQFTSHFWKAFCTLTGASVQLSSGFHLQSNGQTKRANRHLETALSSWSQVLPWVEYTHNSLPVSSTGLSPFQVSFGSQPPLFPSQEEEILVSPAQAFIHKCQRMW